IHSKAKDAKDKEVAKDSPLQPTGKSNKTKYPLQQQQMFASGKKVQPVAPMHKLSQKLSMSPKAPTNQRKKSNASAEADRRLTRTQQLMDGNLERPTGATTNVGNSISTSNSSSNLENVGIRTLPSNREDKRPDNSEKESMEPPRQKPQPVAVAPVQQKRSTNNSPLSSEASAPPSPVTPTPATANSGSQNLPIPVAVTTSMPTSRPSMIPVSAVHPTVYTGTIAGAEPIPIPVMLPVIPTLIPGLTLPIGGVDMTGVSLGALADYYGQISGYDDSNMPVTPTPSLASSISNERTVSRRRGHSILF
ncbi:unnamed protein product, partial [Strongylus vulgaris]